MIGLGRLYTVPFVSVAVSAQQDWFYIKPAADKPVIIEYGFVSNVGGAADAGDAQEELLSVEGLLVPATVTVGSGGSAPTPVPVLDDDTAASFTARVNDTTKATTSGTLKDKYAGGFNVRAAWEWYPPPEHRIWVKNATAFVFRLNSTPADALTLSGYLLVREFS